MACVTITLVYKDGREHKVQAPDNNGRLVKIPSGQMLKDGVGGWDAFTHKEDGKFYQD